MTEQIVLEVLTVHGHTVVAVSGEIDLSTAGALRERLRGQSSGTRQLTVDLENVGFMDSSGLNALIAVWRQLGPRSLHVVASRQRIRRVFSISGTDQIIPGFESMDTAIEAHQGPSPLD